MQTQQTTLRQHYEPGWGYYHGVGHDGFPIFRPWPYRPNADRSPRPAHAVKKTRQAPTAYQADAEAVEACREAIRSQQAVLRRLSWTKRLPAKQQEFVATVQAEHEYFRTLWGTDMRALRVDLTVPHSRYCSDAGRKVEVAYKLFADALRAYLKRRGIECALLYVVGLHSDGTSEHRHAILWTSKYVGKATILSAWQKATKTPGVQVEARTQAECHFKGVSGVLAMARYLAINMSYKVAPRRRRYNLPHVKAGAGRVSQAVMPEALDRREGIIATVSIQEPLSEERREDAVSKLQCRIQQKVQHSLSPPPFGGGRVAQCQGCGQKKVCEKEPDGEVCSQFKGGVDSEE